MGVALHIKDGTEYSEGNLQLTMFVSLPIEKALATYYHLKTKFIGYWQSLLWWSALKINAACDTEVDDETSNAGPSDGQPPFLPSAMATLG